MLARLEMSVGLQVEELFASGTSGANGFPEASRLRPTYAGTLAVMEARKASRGAFGHCAPDWLNSLLYY